MKRIYFFRYMPLLLMAAGVLITGCKKKKENNAAAYKLPVEVAVPEVRDITLTMEYPGYLQAINTVNLVARVSGRLEQISYQPGSRVRRGETLFVIEPTTYQDNVQQAEAALKEGKATLEYAKASYERTKEAYKANAVSEIQVIQTQANYEQALAAVDNYEAQLQTARTNLGYCYIQAPFEGRVSKNQFDIGNYLSGAQAPTLATIYQDDKMYVNFSVSDNQYLKMAIKDKKPEEMDQVQELTIIPDAEENLPSFKAKLDYFAPNIVLSTGTINMRGVIENDEGLLRDGLYVKVVLPYGAQKNAVLIPDASIGTDQLGRYVYVVNDSAQIVSRRVETGQLVDKVLRQIVSGLNPNDHYVTQALLKVRPGMVVDPIMKGQKPEEMPKTMPETKPSKDKNLKEPKREK
ncbi:MAG: efflux RND transporter periplasmic adaptor subunit [Bacteroidales bacterium]